LNEPVTAWRTVATDKGIFPRACLAFISTTLPSVTGQGDWAYQQFALDQDTGGGIRAAGRCDIYMGIGDAAGKLAGRTVQDGKLYYLFLKPGGSTPSDLPPISSPAAAPEMPVK
jgi:membrane-bound lytic murein transglycosylase A